METNEPAFEFEREAYLLADRVDSPQLAVGACGLCSRFHVGENKNRDAKHNDSRGGLSAITLGEIKTRVLGQYSEEATRD